MLLYASGSLSTARRMPSSPSSSIISVSGDFSVITSFSWAGETSRIGTLEKERKLAPIPGSECCTSDPSYLEFMAEGVNKGAGLQAAAESLGLSRQEVMAVGDGHNDLPMLRWAGLSVAMGNASREVKQAARFLTEDCDHDGLAVALKRLVLMADPFMQPDSEGSN